MRDRDHIYEEAKYLSRRDIIWLIVKLSAYLELVGFQGEEDA